SCFLCQCVCLWDIVPITMIDKEVNRYGRYRITVHAVGRKLYTLWQRRWFVLYDDGELTYSVDEHVSKACNLILEANS
ncbi:Protein outspread, partial [Trachymyrmex zeteki]